MRILIPAIVLLLAACSSDPSGTLDGGSGDAARTDTGPADGGPPFDSGPGLPDATPGDAVPEGTPLVERPVDRQVTCSVAVPLTNHTPRSWYQGGHVMVSRGGEAVLVRTESMPPNPFEQAPTSLVFGAVLEDGSLAAPEAASPLPNGTGFPAAAVVGDNLVMVAVDGESLFSVYDGPAGISTPAQLALGNGFVLGMQLVAGHGGAALLVTRYNTGFTHTEFVFARLTATGALDGAPRMLDQVELIAGGSIVATASGWAMLRRGEGGLDLVRLAPDGAEVGRHRVATDGETLPGMSAGFDRGGSPLLVHGDGFLAAWPEVKQTFDAGAYAAIRLARLDANGVPRAPPIWVRAPEVDIDEVEPRLSWLDGRAVLTWGRGTHIYVCAGCMPDHRTDLVVFDPDTLTPLSDVVTLARPPIGGLLQRGEVWVGDTLRIAGAITYHVHSEPGTAVFRCQ